MLTGEELGQATSSLSQQFDVFWTPQGQVGTTALTMGGDATLTIYDGGTRQLISQLAFPLYGSGTRTLDRLV